MAIRGHDDSQLLGRRDNSTDGVDRQLLDDAVDRRSQDLQFRSLFRSNEIAGETSSLSLRLCKIAKQRPVKFSYRLCTGFDDCRERSVGFIQSALLNCRILLIFCQKLKYFQVGELGAEFPISEILSDLYALPNDWLVSFKFANCGGDRIAFGFFLCALSIKRRKFSPIFLGLPRQKLSLHGDKRFARSGRRMKLALRIYVIA